MAYLSSVRGNQAAKHACCVVWCGGALVVNPVAWTPKLFSETLFQDIYLNVSSVSV